MILIKDLTLQLRDSVGIAPNFTLYYFVKSTKMKMQVNFAEIIFLVRILIMRKVVVIFIFLYANASIANNCIQKPIIRSFKPKYSLNFSIDYYSNFKILKTAKSNVLLTSNLQSLDCSFPIKVKTPVNKIVLTSTTYLPSLELLNQEKKLLGFTGKQYIYSNKFDLKNIIEISSINNIELLVKYKPDVILNGEDPATISNNLSKLIQFNIAYVPNFDFLETNPLARAEWLIYNSSLFNLEEEAQKIFEKIEVNYNQEKNKVLRYPKKSVLIGEIQNGKWAHPGAKSDLAIIVQDAGGELKYKKSSDQTQYISLEELLTKELDVDIWLSHNRFNSKLDLRSNPFYKKIKFKKIANYNNSVNKNGSNDYWEMGLQRPDLLLKDLITIFHNDCSNLIWYKCL